MDVHLSDGSSGASIFALSIEIDIVDIGIENNVSISWFELADAAESNVGAAFSYMIVLYFVATGYLLRIIPYEIIFELSAEFYVIAEIADDIAARLISESDVSRAFADMVVVALIA